MVSPRGAVICCHPATAVVAAARISTGVCPFKMPASSVTITPTITNVLVFFIHTPLLICEIPAGLLAC
jgi:hypothetical protein